MLQECEASLEAERQPPATYKRTRRGPEAALRSLARLLARLAAREFIASATELPPFTREGRADDDDSQSD
jgi:hypothetical protein